MAGLWLFVYLVVDNEMTTTESNPWLEQLIGAIKGRIVNFGTDIIGRRKKTNRFHSQLELKQTTAAAICFGSYNRKTPESIR